jgi:hypothetical protein
MQQDPGRSKDPSPVNSWTTPKKKKVNSCTPNATISYIFPIIIEKL